MSIATNTSEDILTDTLLFWHGRLGWCERVSQKKYTFGTTLKEVWHEACVESKKMGKENDIYDKIIRAASAQRRGAGLGILQRSVHLRFPKALGSGFWSCLQIRKHKLRDVINLNSSHKSLDSSTSLVGGGAGMHALFLTCNCSQN